MLQSRPRLLSMFSLQRCRRWRHTSISHMIPAVMVQSLFVLAQMYVFKVKGVNHLPRIIIYLQEGVTAGDIRI